MRAIFATDLSDAARAALDCLCECQVTDFEEIVLVHVIDVDMYTEGGSVPLFLEADRQLLDEQVQRLRDRGLSTRARLEQGAAAAEIERVAAEEEAGLIIIGNVGRGGVRGRLLGGTAEILASEAKTPVLVEKVTGHEGSWCRLAEGHTFRRTMVAVDLSGGSRGAPAAVAGMAGVEAIRLVHVMTGDEKGSGSGSDEDRLALLDEWASDAPAELDVSTELREGDPTAEIALAAFEWGATCLAVGLCGHGHLHRFVWGSVSSALARTLALPVLIVPPRT